MPLVIVLRDVLGSGRHGKRSEAHPGRPRRCWWTEGSSPTYGFPVGLMDVVSIPKIESELPNGARPERQVPIWSRCRRASRAGSCAASKSKTTVSGGKTQLNLHDGRNLLVAKDAYKSGDVLKLEIAEPEDPGRLQAGQGQHRDGHRWFPRRRAGGHRGVHRHPDSPPPTW